MQLPDVCDRSAGGPAPDIAASSDGADAAYFAFPKTLGKSVAEPPAQGGQFTSLVLLTQTPPAPMEQNAAWQEINEQLGTTANLLLVTGADYPTRLSTIVAVGDLPDTLFNIQQYLPNAAEFMRRAVRGPDAVSRRRRHQGLPQPRHVSDAGVEKHHL